jgi:transcriptional regulator with PAS, ATPase and Fis domain
MAGNDESRSGRRKFVSDAPHATARTAPASEGDLQPSTPASSAGLVLLYSPGFRTLAPAYAFDHPTLDVGREAPCDIVVDDHAVSRRHARITLQGASWTITDLGSRNGVYLDGERVSSAVLEPLHEIRIGNALFKFVDRHAEQHARYRIDGAVDGSMPHEPEIAGLVGGYVMRRVEAAAARIARTSLSCVVLGETGTGKEVFARAVHRMSARTGAFQAIHCGAIPHELLESELFGYRRGAFSGAQRDKSGLIELAHKGTLFLDEIGDMPLDAQVKLLRVLQSHEVTPLGGTRPQQVDLRVVSATHRDLYRYVQEGRFRGDLFARLNEYTTVMPPLRERKEDIFALVRAFVARHADRPLEPSLGFMSALLQYDWPFNVRELESTVKRAAAFADGGVLEATHLPVQVLEASASPHVRTRSSTAPPSALPAVVLPRSEGHDLAGSDPERVVPARDAPSEADLKGLLARHTGNVAATARELGTSRMQVYRWLRRYGVEVSQYRG